MEQAVGSKLNESEQQLEATAAQVTSDIIDNIDAAANFAIVAKGSASKQTAEAQPGSNRSDGSQQVDESCGSVSGGQRLRDKFSHRSQSSPSSLTTHKFGLKPTPSPPRLIIDHQTGDIVESYPEQPIYLRTYQPLDSSSSPYIKAAPPVTAGQTTTTSIDIDSDADQSSSLAANVRHIDLEPVERIGGSSSAATMSGSHRRAQRSPSNEPRPFIPPPHSGKVYFAPPACQQPHQLHPNQPSSGANQANLFDRQQQLELAAAASDLSVASRNQQQPTGTTATDQWRHLAGVAMASTPAAAAPQQQQQQHFRRTLNRLDENAPTDIAIVTDENGLSVPPHRIPVVKHSPATPPMSSGQSTPRSKQANPLQNQHHANQYKQLRRQKKQSSGSFSSSNNGSTSLQSIEDFDLYNFCYNFRVLLVCLLSIMIIYLLCFPLNSDCALYRPTQTYISIIVASVNLICVAIFTLFWYCNGVTRTLYANLSSSAFIITIYSILVGINLAIAILFFFINTCHFQKLSNTQMSFGDVASFLEHRNHFMRRSLDFNNNRHMGLNFLVAPSLNSIEQQPHNNPIPSQTRRTHMSRIEPLVAAAPDDTNDDLDFASPQTPAPAADDEDRLLDDYDESTGEPQVESEEYLFQRYTMSPVEAAWRYIEDEFVYLRRKVYRFVYKYDLKFIGALHGLCAICFQFLAIKVAVVRSHYCAPVGLAD